PADRAVYPMKLTQLAGSTTHVQLFVVANRQARADGFRVAAADRYRKLPGIEPIAPGPYRGESTSLVIGSPDAGDLLWDSCVVTTLTADVPPQAMDRDVELSFGDLDPYRDCVYSVAGRNDLALSILFGGGTLVVACCMLAFGDRRKSRRIDRRVIAALIVLTLIASVGVRLLLSAVDVHVSRRWHDRWWLTTMEDVAYELVEDGVLRSDMTLGELADFPRLAVERRRAVEEELLNPYTGEPMKCERSPGNFSMRKGDDDLAYFCFYDVNGCERRVPLFRPPPKILPDD
ncbi:MAG: hypothetical protein JXL80_07645, partial [Planctomycetes bacterium]|nr:hypothetical protein [Planctomycetota bacterium]